MIKKYLSLLAVVSAFFAASLFGQETGSSDHAALFEAINRTDAETVQRYIQDHPEAIHAQNDNQQTPLHRAAENGSANIAQILLTAGACGDAQDGKQATPLHQAARKGDLATTQTLLMNGASVNRADLEYNTPIHLAAEQGHFSVVRYLVDNACIVHEKNLDEDTPLHLAAASGSWRLVAFLKSRGADIETTNSYGQTPLCLAAGAGKLSVVRFLIHAGAQLEIGVIQAAAVAGHVSVVQFFLTEYPNCIESPNSNGLTLLENAIQYLHLPVVNLLLKHGANTDGAHGQSVLERCRQVPSLSRFIQDSAIVAQNERKRNHIIRFLFYNGAPLGKAGNIFLQTKPGLKQAIENYNWNVMDSLPDNTPGDLKLLILSFASPVKVRTTEKRKREAENQPNDVREISHEKKQRRK